MIISLSGCTHYQAKPLALPGAAQTYTERSLNDPELQQRLQALHLMPAGQTDFAGWDRAQLLVIASERNAKLRTARAELAAASAGITTATALPNPTVSLGSEYDLSQAAESPWLWSLTTDWLLDAGLRRQLRVQLANVQLRTARLDYAEAVWSVRSELRGALLSYLLNLQRQKLLATSVSSQERLLQLLRQRVALGAAAASESLPMELELARARSALLDNTAQQSQALATLAQVLGMPPSALQAQPFNWPDLIHVTDVDEGALNTLREQALLARADLERAVLTYQTRELELQQAVRQQYPQLSIGPGYTWDHGIRKATLGVSFSLPVFNRNQGPIAAAEAQRNSAGEQALAVQAQIFNDINIARQDYQNAVQTLASVLQQSDAAEAQLQQLRRAHSLGDTDQAGVLAAQLSADAQSLLVLDAVQRMQQALGKLEDAVRTPLSGPELALGKGVLLDGR